MDNTIQTRQYSLPIALQNLSPAETLNQMIDNLNFLCKVMDDTCMVISNQCNSERNKIKSITKRVEVCRQKTDLIAKFPSKATTVYSQEEYPLKGYSKDELLVTMIENPTGPNRPKYKLSVKQRLEQPQYKDTLQLFHSVTQKTTKKHEDKPVGLGALPQWLTSVSDCLLFNNDKNPYVKYELRDLLEGEEAKEKRKEDTNVPVQPQPPTIGKKISLMDHQAFDLRYEPHMDKVPEFRIGQVVPGLSGVALDVNYQIGMTNRRGIAPSAVQFGNLPDLGALPDVAFVDDAPGPALPLKNLTPPPIPQLQTQFQSQPQAQPQSYMQPQQSQLQPQPVQQMVPTIPAPKPIQPLEENPAPKAAPAAPVSKKPAKEVGRMAMLDEIRNPGKKLKPAASKKVAEKPKPEPQKAGLMDHLKAKLAQRNKLMRGLTDNEDLKVPTLNEDTNASASAEKKSNNKAGGYGEVTEANNNTGLPIHQLRHMSTIMNLEEDDDDPADKEGDNDWE